jgi:hypothetical protein
MVIAAIHVSVRASVFPKSFNFIKGDYNPGFSFRRHPGLIAGSALQTP